MKTIIDELIQHMDYATLYERKLITSICQNVLANNCLYTRMQELRLRGIHRRVITRLKIQMNAQKYNTRH